MFKDYQEDSGSKANKVAMLTFQKLKAFSKPSTAVLPENKQQRLKIVLKDGIHEIRIHKK